MSPGRGRRGQILDLLHNSTSIQRANSPGPLMAEAAHFPLSSDWLAPLREFRY
jgi:hypothetical protein